MWFCTFGDRFDEFNISFEVRKFQDFVFIDVGIDLHRLHLKSPNEIYSETNNVIIY